VGKFDQNITYFSYFCSRSQYQNPARFSGAEEKQVSSAFFGAAYSLKTFSPVL
jgi:hypothetical protein